MIEILAEAFEISVKFPDIAAENRLDFGIVRVNDIEEKTFKCVNEGLYDVNFNFVMKK